MNNQTLSDNIVTENKFIHNQDDTCSLDYQCDRVM